MINNSDVSEFVGSLSNHLQILINRIANQETWSSDNENDVYTLIEELSDALSKTTPEMLSRTSHLLLTNSAYFNLPRFLKFITFIAEQNPQVINQMLSPLNKERVVEGEIYLNTVVSRLRYMIQSVLVSEIFSPELMKRVQIAVLEYESLNESSKVNKKPASDSADEEKETSAVSKSDFDFDINEFDADMPFASNEDEQVKQEDETQGTVTPPEEHPEVSPEATASTSTEPNIAEGDIKSRIKQKSSYNFKKQEVLSLLNKLKDSESAK